MAQASRIDQVTVHADLIYEINGEDLPPAEGVWLVSTGAPGEVLDPADNDPASGRMVLSLPAQDAASYQVAATALRRAAAAHAHARRVWEAAQEEWKAATAAYRAAVDEPLTPLIEAEEQRLRDEATRAEEEARAQQVAETARAEAEADARFGPRQFMVVSKTTSRRYHVATTRTVHLEGCRFARYAYGDPVRSSEALDAVLTDGASLCGTCRAEHRIRAGFPDAATMLDEYQAGQRDAYRPVEKRRVYNLLKKVARPVYVDSRTGDGSSGWLTELRGYGKYGHLRVTWNSPGIGQVEFGDQMLNDLSATLIANGYHVTWVEASRRDILTGKRQYSEIQVTRMTINEEALAQAAGPDLLLAAAKVGMYTPEAIEHAKAGDLTADGIATLAALRDD